MTILLDWPHWVQTYNQSNLTSIISECISAKARRGRWFGEMVCTCRERGIVNRSVDRCWGWYCQERGPEEKTEEIYGCSGRECAICWCEKRECREQGWLEADDWLQPSLKSNHEEVDANFCSITHMYLLVYVSTFLPDEVYLLRLLTFTKIGL